MEPSKGSRRLEIQTFSSFKDVVSRDIALWNIVLLAMASGERARELAALGAAPPSWIFPHKDRGF